MSIWGGDHRPHKAAKAATITLCRHKAAKAATITMISGKTSAAVLSSATVIDLTACEISTHADVLSGCESSTCSEVDEHAQQMSVGSHPPMSSATRRTLFAAQLPFLLQCLLPAVAAASRVEGAGAAFRRSSEEPPRILSCVAGLPRCIGVPGLKEAREWGCPIVNVTQKDGSAEEETCSACKTQPANILAICAGQGLKNATGRDGTPVTFSLPVDMESLDASFFRWTLSDGRQTHAECAFPNGGPAAEPNERQAIAIIGDAGGWSTASIEKLEIVGPLMLLRPDGTKVSAEGLEYDGPSLVWENGAVLLDARLEVFSTEGETLRGGGVRNQPQFPNHCRVNFPETTHRIRMLWDGGVSNDGNRELTPDRTDLFRIVDAAGAELPASSVLGLADLGSEPAPRGDAERDAYVADGDNYLDVCLALADGAAKPAEVTVVCGPTTQISMPKGLRRASNGLAPRADMKCKRHAVAVKSSSPLTTTPPPVMSSAPTSTKSPFAAYSMRSDEWGREWWSAWWGAVCSWALWLVAMHAAVSLL